MVEFNSISWVNYYFTRGIGISRSYIDHVFAKGFNSSDQGRTLGGSTILLYCNIITIKPH